MKIISKYSGWLMFATCLAIVFVALTWVTPLFQVKTGSMEPTLPVGSSVLNFRTGNYQRGDIITFHDSEGYVVTHRLVEVTKSGELITKGDANPTRDYWKKPLSEQNVIGKVIAFTPFTSLAAWTTPRGLGIMCCVTVLLMALFWKIEDETENGLPAEMPILG